MTQSSRAEGADRLAEITARVVAFAEEREWNRFHDPKNLAMALASEVGELSAILRWVSTDDADDFCAQPDMMARLEAEVGDIGILLLLLTQRLGIDLPAAVAAKLDVNAANYPVSNSRGRSERPRRERVDNRLR